MGRIESDVTRRQRDLLAALGLPVKLPDVDRAALIAAMRRDKKFQRGRPRCVLPSRLGHVEVVSDLDWRRVRAALDG
jgi:3-dehydroquinate synthase